MLCCATGPAGMGGALCIDPEAASYKQQATSLTKRDKGLFSCKAGSLPTGPNDSGTEGCCFWGRGSIQLTGRKNYGNFNNALKNIVNVCENPNLICLEPELRWLGGLHYWITVVQKDPNFMPQLKKYIDLDSPTDPNTLIVSIDDRCPQQNPSINGCPNNPGKIPNSFPSGCSAMVNMGNWNASPMDEKNRVSDFCALVSLFK